MTKKRFEDFMEKVVKNKKLLQMVFLRHNKKFNKTPCLSHETMTDLLNHTLPADKEELVFNHISFCDNCLEGLKFLYDFLKNYEDPEDVQMESEYERTEVKESHFVLVIKSFHNRVATVFQDGGFMPLEMMLPSAVREDKSAEDNNFVAFSRKIFPFLFQLECEKKENKLFYLRILVTYETNKPANDIRLSLFKDDEEYDSYLTKEGMVSFDKLDYGKYLIKVSEKGTKYCEFHISFV